MKKYILMNIIILAIIEIFLLQKSLTMGMVGFGIWILFLIISAINLQMKWVEKPNKWNAVMAISVIMLALGFTQMENGLYFLLITISVIGFGVSSSKELIETRNNNR